MNRLPPANGQQGCASGLAQFALVDVNSRLASWGYRTAVGFGPGIRLFCRYPLPEVSLSRGSEIMISY